jgi:hypothetical protein
MDMSVSHHPDEFAGQKDGYLIMDSGRQRLLVRFMGNL